MSLKEIRERDACFRRLVFKGGDDIGTEVNQTAADRRELLAHVERLKQYGTHIPVCAKYEWKDCDCGWEAALAALEDA